MLPILWFGYFFRAFVGTAQRGSTNFGTPARFILEELQIPPRKFAEVNLMLIALITTIYEVGAIESWPSPPLLIFISVIGRIGAVGGLLSPLG